MCIDINMDGAMGCTFVLSKNKVKVTKLKLLFRSLLRKFVVSHGSLNPAGKSSS